MYAPALFPLADTLRVGLRAEVWLTWASPRAPGIVLCTVITIAGLDVGEVCSPVGAPSGGVFWEAPR